MRLPAALRVSAAPLTAAVAIAAAAVVWHHLPTNSDVLAPFDVHGSVGTATSGRALSAKVIGVRIAPQVTPPGIPKPLAAAGTWVVVDATVAAANDSLQPHSDLLVGGATYLPTDRLLPGATLGTTIQPGIPQRGLWVFDVAPALLKDAGRVQLRVWSGDERLDSRLVIDIDMAAAYSIDTVALERPAAVMS